MRKIIPIFIFVVVLWSCGGGGGGSGSSTTTFEVNIENISNSGTFQTASGRPAVVVFSPGVFVVHEEAGPYFIGGEPARPNGLESLAEDGNPASLIDSLSLVSGVSLIGIVRTPVGQTETSAIGPGDSYKAVIRATEGSNFSLAMSFLQSNDLFVSPAAGGIPLFDGNGNPISGDVSGSFLLLDAGTEVNQRPGEGADQGIRQGGVNSGETEVGGIVQPVSDGFRYPAVGSMLRVTVTPVS